MREDRGKRLFNSRNIPMVLLTLDVSTLMYLSNVIDGSNTRPRSSVDETCWIGLSLKNIGGCTIFFVLRSKNNLCLFIWVRVETHFLLKSPFIYFVEILANLFSSCIWIIYYSKQRNIVCKKVLHLIGDFQLDRLYTYTRTKVLESNFVEL